MSQHVNIDGGWMTMRIGLTMQHTRYARAVALDD